ncbi:VacB/RNase II family 3'-5' exoribonuclease [Limnothrix sp. FACHB-708]|uniref:ribonuclease catalytic domain-containing protein n=1 Tax=unclassified Limnothrix TaxID=2632864 RepID=UPI0016849C39|nr:MULTISPECIES: ribonuclease R family protein [unclassified Limnothrix]MBD2553174.1 VacB/RNase II family 3'-5' exoribonuclease [Limnothrix sp. FACHB-708]MBD2590802.1 VacB/RNase II family 3'-5' exoribonuclease [Limnothrix sp. FACHB-406]
MDKGTLVELRLDDERVLATIDRPEGKKLFIAIGEQGKNHKIRPQDVTYTVGGGFQPADIAAFRAATAPYFDPDSLEVAWELLCEEDNRAVDAKELSLILFSEASPVTCYAAHRMLSEDKLFFKQKGDRYEPRPASQVSEMRRQQELTRQREQEQQAFCEWVQSAISSPGDRPEIPDDSPFRQRLELLERYAVQGDEMTNRSAALDLLAKLDRPTTERGAFDLLVALGLWSPHENLHLRRSQLPTRFSAKVLDVARAYLESPPPDLDRDRLDLVHLKTYTIDDESTREIDDGLSLEFLSDGTERIWVHIADPTRWLEPGNELDLEARRRATTVYLPTGPVPMFPHELATGPMSLVQGRQCCALSFGIVLNENGSVADYQIRASHVKPTYRLTYDDVDEMLDLGITDEPQLTALAKWAKRRESWRASQGAIRIEMPETSIAVKDDEIEIRVLGDSTARGLVAEMMILAGEVAARYGQEHSLPMPFRSQPQPELPPAEELMLLPAGPVRACAIRRCMPRSEMSTTPARHSSLALDTYTQITSPIRRYTDLLGHFQIKAHLRGETLPFSINEMQELVQGVSSTAYEATLVERQTTRYWILEYLRRNRGPWQTLMLRWLREDDGLAAVLLEDLGVELATRFHRDLSPGDRLWLEVSHADPRQDSIQFRETAVDGALAESVL